jgi:uncharacterized membrane protein HdeD (DUF308 family)
MKLSAIGELFTSLRAEDYRLAYRSEFAFGGALLLALIAAGFWSRRRQWRPSDVYFAVYAAIIFVYPFFGYGPSRRFWFPVLPLAVALAFSGICRIWIATRLRSVRPVSEP